jgi:hypothetical protein
MTEDLSAPYPGYGFGAMDAYDGYVAYRLLDENALAGEIAHMRDLMERSGGTLEIEQDLGLGMMLWLAHFFPAEDRFVSSDFSRQRPQRGSRRDG